MTLNQVNAVILVGGPGQSSLREIAGHPVSLLPIPGEKHFLYAWLKVLLQLDAVTKVDVLTGRQEDLRMLSAATEHWDKTHLGQTGVYADHENHRGTAGALKDFVNSLGKKSDLLVIEGNRIPPLNPNAIFDVSYDRSDVIGSLGRTREYGPSGVFLMKNRMLDLIPEIGFFDLKEQLIPRALERGERVIVQQVSGMGSRLSDMKSYLECVREMGKESGKKGEGGPWIDPESEVHPGANLGAGTLVDGKVRIGRDVATKNSVILGDSVIGEDALIVDSIIRAGSNIPRGTKVIRGTVYNGQIDLIRREAHA